MIWMIPSLDFIDLDFIDLVYELSAWTARVAHPKFTIIRVAQLAGATAAGRDDLQTWFPAVFWPAGRQWIRRPTKALNNPDL
jgi:hypothetical protein